MLRSHLVKLRKKCAPRVYCGNDIREDVLRHVQWCPARLANLRCSGLRSRTVPIQIETPSILFLSEGEGTDVYVVRDPISLAVRAGIPRRDLDLHSSETTRPRTHAITHRAE